MDPVTLAIVVGALVVLGVAAVAAMIALWVLRKTMALVKRLFFVSIAFVVLAVVVAGAAALTLMGS